LADLTLVAKGLQLPRHLDATVRYFDSRVRPLRRRAATMRRPALLDMRARNPWVRALFRFFGWYVRFICFPL